LRSRNSGGRWGWPARFIESDDLAVDYSFVGHRGQRLSNGRIPGIEILVVARPEMDSAARLERYSPEAVEL
jgi:hypothetical protein